MRVSTETQCGIRNQLVNSLELILAELTRGNDIELRKSPDGIKVLVVRKQMLVNASEK